MKRLPWIPTLFLLTLILLIQCDANVGSGGSGCGTTYNEAEAVGTTDNVSPGTIENFNITLAPGCKVIIKGWVDNGGGTDDWYDSFTINTGNASGVYFTTTWDNSNDAIDIYVLDQSYNTLSQSTGFQGGSEELLWSINVKNYTRYVTIVAFSANTNYTLTIEAY